MRSYLDDIPALRARRAELFGAPPEPWVQPDPGPGALVDAGEEPIPEPAAAGEVPCGDIE